MVKAIYAFSGDPITNGHIDVIRRAASAFDELIVGIGANPEKKYTFGLEERTEMAQKVLANMPNVKVVSFNGMLSDYAYEHGIKVIVKGARNSTDFDYESILHQVNESQKLGLETHILFARPELAHVSSSVVKAIQKEQGLVHEYVPLCVKQKLEERISGQYVFGITGEIASGKSYVSEKFGELGAKYGIEVHNIDLDRIAHRILGDLSEPAYKIVREEVARQFGTQVLQPDGSINRKILGELVFGDYAQLQKLNKIMAAPLIVRLRREMYGKRGLILLNAALLAEAGMNYICNNNVALVICDTEDQKRRLGLRGLDDEQIERRLASQYSIGEKKEKIQEAIEKNNYGNFWVIDGSDNRDETLFEKTFAEIVRGLKYEKSA